MFVSHRYRIVYYPMPKNASSSLKHVLFEIDAGRPFDNQEGWPKSFIHSLYPAQPNGGFWTEAFKNYFSFFVIRDPIERFVSGFNNRVYRYGDVNPETKNNQGELLPTEPEINFFIDNLAFYLNYSKVLKSHFQLQLTFVNNVIDKVNKIYTVANLDGLYQDLKNHTGLEKIQPRNRNRNKDNNSDIYSVNDINDKNKAVLKKIYHKDYVMFQKYL